jgi:hypothetical protein
VHRAWLGGLVAVQLAFLFLMPVFSGNDERAHFDRMWALVEGRFFCDTVPQAVRELDHLQTPACGLREYWRVGLQLRDDPARIYGKTYACYYFPAGVALPALATRLVAFDLHGHLRRGGPFLATFAARLVSLATVDAALIFFLVAVPWARSFALAFFSIPMAIEQSVSYGHDNLLFALCLVVLALALSRCDWMAVALIALCTTVMTLEKPVFIGFSLLALPMIVQLWPRADWKRRLCSLSLLAPSLAYRIWYRLGDVRARMWTPSWVFPEVQVLFLKRQPRRFLRVMVGYLHQLLDDHKYPYFEPRRINGEWTTLFFANLWLEIPKLACLAAALGLLAAMAADVMRGDSVAPLPRDLRARVARALSVLGVASAIPLTVLALYVTYTPVGQDWPNAVQGRYHACAWLALSLLLLRALPRRAWRGSTAATLAAAAMMLVADVWVLRLLVCSYWP